MACFTLIKSNFPSFLDSLCFYTSVQIIDIACQSFCMEILDFYYLIIEFYFKEVYKKAMTYIESYQPQ